MKSLEKAATYLRANNVPHVEWHEPDFEIGFTSIATSPIRGEQRELFKKYRVYNASVAQQPQNAATGSGGEHSVFNGGVASENLARGSNFVRA